MRYEKEFRKDNPQTIGETDKYYDLDNYKDWIDNQHSELLSALSDLKILYMTEPLGEYLEPYKEAWRNVEKVIKRYN